MATIEIPIYMRGVTGRMARRQHLERSLMAIAKEGGLKTPGGDVIMPKPYLLGPAATISMSRSKTKMSFASSLKAPSPKFTTRASPRPSTRACTFFLRSPSP